jgi:type II secretory pathway pseudopilin PulG
VRDAALATERSTQGGFTYLGLMFIVALMGLMLALASSAWSFVSQRDLERELLFCGGEYRRAIEGYRQAHDGQQQPYPDTLAQLLGARELSGVRHYLRRLYPDPFTGRLDWGLVRTPQGGIVGVYSTSSRVPLRTQGGGLVQAIDFAHAKAYRDWVFVAAVPLAGAGISTTESNQQGAPPPTVKPPPSMESDNP